MVLGVMASIALICLSREGLYLPRSTVSLYDFSILQRISIKGDLNKVMAIRVDTRYLPDK